MRFGKININPAKNPAILDTATWHEKEAYDILALLDGPFWSSVRSAVEARACPERSEGKPLPTSHLLTAYRGSAAQRGSCVFVLAGLVDGQHVFVEIGSGEGQGELGAAFTTIGFEGELQMRVYRTDAAIIDRYCQVIRPDNGPRALAALPRLGVGVRMSSAMWPGVYQAMDACGFAANAIQNSVRELELLENVLEARRPEAIYYPGFGTVESGHTGSTFEGLWTYGVLEALKHEGQPSYGADADHVKVMPGERGLARAKQVLQAARYYSFYTLDLSGVLDYGALWVSSPARAEAYLSTRLPSSREQKAVLAYHRQGRRIGGVDYKPDEATLGCLVGKYWDALAASEELVEFLTSLKGGRPFDLEFAIDERPPEVGTCECITSDEELVFVLLEAKRRGLPLTHVAPNFGVEKGVDYRCPGGLAELEARVRTQYRIADEFGLLLDFHSGDDLSAETRRVMGRATKGRNHFKIAPQPQIIFAETVADFYPDLFQRWWEDALAYARREAEAGSEFAKTCIREFEAAAGIQASPHDDIFHNFGFAFVGRRDEQGQYLNRETLYSLSQDFYKEYQDRIVAYLCELARDLFGPSTG